MADLADKRKKKKLTSPEELQSLAPAFVEEFNEAKSLRASWKTNALKVYRLYRLYRSQKTFDWQANVVVPKLFEAIEALAANMLLGTYQTLPIVRVLPTREGDWEAAVNVQELLDDDYTDADRMLLNYEWFKTGLLYGVGITKSFYNPETGRVEEELVDPFRFYVDPDSRIQKQNAVYEERYVTLDYLRAQAEKGIYQKELVEKLTTEMVQTGAEERLKEVGRETSYRATKVSLVERWKDDTVTTLANNTYVIRHEEDVFESSHQGHPYSFYHCIPVPMEFFSMGDGEVARSGNEELNEIRNQRLDNLALYMNQVLLVDTDKVSLDDVLWRPGKLIPVTGDTDAVKPLVQPNVQIAGIDMEETVKADIEAATGAYRYLIGGTPARQETATAIMELQAKGGRRSDTKLLLAGYALVKKAQKQVALYQAYASKPIYIGKGVTSSKVNFFTFTKKDLQGRFKFETAVTSSAENKMLRRRDLLEVLHLFSSNPVFRDIVEIRELAKRVLESFDFPHPELLLVGGTSAPTAPEAGIPPGVPPQLAPSLSGARGAGGNGGDIERDVARFEELLATAATPTPPVPPDVF